MRVEDLDLPIKAKEALVRRGIVELYPPQELAVRAGLLEGENVIVTAPTAAGKTLIAILAAIRHLHEGLGKILYLTPLRSLASEKYEEFSDLFGELGFKTAISMGDYDSSDPWLEKYDIIVATNEKADSLVRHRAPWLGSISLIVADEIHLVNEQRRGPTLELLISRLRRVRPEAQLVGLSATIANLDEVASWLNATPIYSDWRPVTLREGVYYEGLIEFGDGGERDVDVKYGNAVMDLVHDSLLEGGQVLVFTFRRRGAVAKALKLGRVVEKTLRREERKALRKLSLELVSVEKNTVTEKLAAAILKGAAFHHAGLSHFARKFIEDAFRRNVIKVIVATPTLAAGVNLPARRVVIAERRRFNAELGIHEEISVMEYKQMAGRAGRPKYDKVGEAVLLARTLDEVDFLMEEYVKASPERIISKLASEHVLRSQLLAEIASGLASDVGSLRETLEMTLYAKQFNLLYLAGAVRRVLRELEEGEFVEVEGNGLKATPLGKRVSELYVDPRSASLMIECLKEREEKFSELTYLHMVASTPDMVRLYLRRGEYEWLDKVVEDREAELAFPPPPDPDEYEFFLASLKVALLLLDWIEENPDDYLYERYDIGPGDLYSIVQTGEWLLYAASELSRLLGLYEHLRELSLLKQRVKYGVRQELLELVSIKGIGRVRARALYSHGFKSLVDVVEADEDELARIPSIGPTLARRLKEAVLEGKPLPEARVESRRRATLDRFL